uniref:Thioredoxin-like protein AAED1 n=1 Tax=Phallusia mammillata TaxID=59560 RepID=A0A6F9DQD8_9ASCI|nr:thioredoxin-like protein AAED1 [Phallusia mammillata]
MEPPEVSEMERMPEKLFNLEDADKCILLDRFGKPVSLGDARSGHTCIIVFLRHFLDYITKEYVEDFSKIFPRYLKERNVKILLISCAPSRFIQPFSDETNCPHEMLCDSKRIIHNTLGLHNTLQPSLNGANSPHIKSNAFTGFFTNVWRAVKSTVEQGDPFQQGGQVIIDPDGKILFFHRESHPHDHTPINELLKVIGMERIDFKTKYKIHNV